MKKVLMVDDSPTILSAMKSFLEAESFDCMTARSGTEAMAALKTHKFDAMITDLNMPGMTGIDLVREARKLPAGRFIPILMLTTESHVERRTEARAAGATGWLTKPVSGRELVGTLKRLLPGA